MLLVVFSVFLMCQSNKIIYYLLINNSQNHHFNTSSARFLKIVNFTGTTYSPFYYLCYRPENGLAGNLPIVCRFYKKGQKLIRTSVLSLLIMLPDKIRLKMLVSVIPEAATLLLGHYSAGSVTVRASAQRAGAKAI